MTCSNPYYPVSAVPVDVTAPITSVVITKTSETTTTENLRITVYVGSGSGGQPNIDIYVNGTLRSTNGRPINGSTYLDITVDKGIPQITACAT